MNTGSAVISHRLPPWVLSAQTLQKQYNSLLQFTKAPLRFIAHWYLSQKGVFIDEKQVLHTFNHIDCSVSELHADKCGGRHSI